MADETLPTTDPVESAVKELRVCREFMLARCGVLDRNGHFTEAVHYLRTSLTSLDDCLDALEKPELPTHQMDDVFVRQETLAEDRRMDRSMDRWDR